MKTIFVMFLAACAYGQGAYTGPKITENGKEVVYTTGDQVIHRLAYFSLSPSLTWFDAQLECISQGYKGLVNIKSQETQSAVEFALVAFEVGNHCPWIGLYRTASSDDFKWSDGTVLGNFANWYASPGTKTAGVCLWATNSKWYVQTTTAVTIDCFLCES